MTPSSFPRSGASNKLRALQRLTHAQLRLAVVITLAINIAAFVCQVVL